MTAPVLWLVSQLTNIQFARHGHIDKYYTGPLDRYDYKFENYAN
ncbi:MAG: hypothetical protein ACLTZT_15605 [Butyricimonas faecalis]